MRRHSERVGDPIDGGHAGVRGGAVDFRAVTAGFEELHVILRQTDQLCELLLREAALSTQLPNASAKLLGLEPTPHHFYMV